MPRGPTGPAPVLLIRPPRHFERLQPPHTSRHGTLPTRSSKTTFYLSGSPGGSTPTQTVNRIRISSLPRTGRLHLRRDEHRGSGYASLTYVLNVKNAAHSCRSSGAPRGQHESPMRTFRHRPSPRHRLYILRSRAILRQPFELLPPSSSTFSHQIFWVARPPKSLAAQQDRESKRKHSDTRFTTHPREKYNFGPMPLNPSQCRLPHGQRGFSVRHGL
jgi:hypothetical protein